MSTRTILAAAVAACLSSPLTALAADPVPNPAPATTTAAMQPVKATISGVTGIVAVRDNDEAPWRPAEVGMVVPVGVEVRTGPRSSITFALPHQALTLDRLGRMKLLEAMAGDTRLKTDVGMPYGRVRYSVEAAGLEHESTIRSPSNALAIRGSDVEITDDGLDNRVVVYKGQGQVVTADGYVVTLGRSAEADYGTQPYTVNIDQADPVQSWFGQTTTPYTNSVSLSEGEQQLVSTNTSVGGMETGVGSWNWRGRGWQGGGTVPTVIDNGGAGGGGGSTGSLRFTLSWTGHNEPGTRLPDLDLFVLAPGGPLLSPKGITQSGTGRILGDAGGSIGTSGQEIAEFLGSFPLGNYRYGVDYVSGEDPATFGIDVRLNGQRINPDYEDTVTPDDTHVEFRIGISLAEEQGTAAQAKDARAAGKSTAKTAIPKKPAAKKPAAKAPQKPAAPKKQPPLRPQKIATPRR